jgi:hypothetical protein
MKRVATLVLAALLLGGCGEDGGSTDAQKEATRELERAQKELRKERRKLERQSRRADRAGTDPGGESSSDEGDGGSGSGGDSGRVPGVEGKDHQLAQDTMQAAGFYILSEEDASGEARPMIYDRNWTVVSQSPKPGTRAPLDRTIILRAKKDDE